MKPKPDPIAPDAGSNPGSSQSAIDRRRFLTALVAGAGLAPFVSRARGAEPPLGANGPALCFSGNSQLLNPATDLTYKGMFRLFAPDGATTFLGYSYGALTGRVVNGEIRLFVVGTFPERNGKTEPVYEVAYPGVGANLLNAPVAPLVTAWGDIYQGRRATGHGNYPVTRGLLWADDVLLWAYGDTYNAGIPSWDPSVGATVRRADGTLAAYGPWRTSLHSQMTRGYMVRNPTTGQVGYGAPTTSGAGASPWGAIVAQGPVPSLGTRPSAVGNQSDIAFEVSPLIYHDIEKRQLRYDTNYKLCGWNVQYDNAAGGFTQPGPDTFDSIDLISAAAWVKTPAREGIVCFGQMTQTIPGHTYGGGDTVTHRWYGPSTCVHGQDGSGVSTSVGEAAGSQVLQVWVFDPANPNADPAPVPLRTLVPALNKAGTLYQFGGAWFEPVSSLLFVSEVGADGLSNRYETQPVVHVFKVRSA